MLVTPFERVVFAIYERAPGTPNRAAFWRQFAR
jgi:hypothetical protein